MEKISQPLVTNPTVLPHKRANGPLSDKAEVPGHSAELSQEIRESNWPPEADAPVWHENSYDSTGVWETDSCPAGSLVVFAEALRHTGADWTHEDHARNAILMAYNHVSDRWHEDKPCMNATVVGGLAPERAGFFREVWSFAQTAEAREREAAARAERAVPGVAP